MGLKLAGNGINCFKWICFPLAQPLPVQRWEHDGCWELGHRVRPDPPAHAGRSGPGGLSGAREWGHQNGHPEPRQHLPRHQGAARARLWEVYDRRPVLVRVTAVIMSYSSVANQIHLVFNILVLLRFFCVTCFHLSSRLTVWILTYHSAWLHENIVISHVHHK